MSSIEKIQDIRKVWCNRVEGIWDMVQNFYVHLLFFRTKFYELDLKPVCKTCHEKFPTELKKRLKKAYESSPAKK